MLEQIVSLAAAAMILIAYGGQQAGKLRPDSYTYLLLNMFGAAVLALIALRIKQLGLTVVEASWMLISIVAVARLALRRKT